MWQVGHTCRRPAVRGGVLLLALLEEQDEPDLAELPRLVFHFDRRSHGRLRQLINRLNDRPTESADQPSP